jgi:transcription elongation factor Elf1
MKKEQKKFQSKPVKKVETRAVCKICGKKFYSLTTNAHGSIICVNCDKDLNQRY